MGRNKARIKVYLTDVGNNNEPTFHLRSNLPSHGGGNHPVFEFKNNGLSGFELTFELIDQTNNGMGSGYQFAMDENDAVWSQLGSDCPDRAVVPAVFTHPTRTDDTTLVVINENPDTGKGAGQGQFQYTLNVSQDGNPPYVHIDPGGKNMNGVGQSFPWRAIAVAIAVAASIACFARYRRDAR